MKKINAVQLAVSFAGCFLGAGYVSGQELWQFFGSFGLPGLFSVPVAAALLGLFSYIVIRLAQCTHIGDMDRLVIRHENKTARGIFAFLEIFFLFGVFVVMTAGAGALFGQVFGISQTVACVIFSLVIGVVAIGGLSGMLTVFSVIVPVLAVMSVVIFVVATSKNGVHLPEYTVLQNDNPLLRSPILATPVFASYNFFASIGVLAPLGEKIEKRRTVFVGLGLGMGIIGVIAVCILLTLFGAPDAVSAQLPMLEVSRSTGIVFYYIFALLIFAGMFGSAVSSLFAVTAYAERKFPEKKRVRAVTAVACAVVGIPCSLLGFNKLIGTLYPLCGYFGFAALVCLSSHYIIVYKNSKKVKINAFSEE